MFLGKNNVLCSTYLKIFQFVTFFFVVKCPHMAQ